MTSYHTKFTIQWELQDDNGNMIAVGVAPTMDDAWKEIEAALPPMMSAEEALRPISEGLSA